MTEAQTVERQTGEVLQRSSGPPSGHRSLVVRIAERFSVDPDKLLSTLKATAFRQRADKQGEVREPTNEEMMALLILADIYKLNPFSRELFAYFDPKSKAIIPIVSVDGWIRIINEQPSLRSISFTYSPETAKHAGKTVHEWMEVEIVRSDRDKPMVIREYFAEVVRKVDFVTPWDSHPNRMHRHKTMIQGGRYAFGFGGIYDEDEAARIIDGEARREHDPAALARLNEELGGNGKAKALSAPEQGRTVPAGKIPREGELASMPAGETIRQEPGASSAEPPAEEVEAAFVRSLIDKASNVDQCDEARDLIRSVKSERDRAELDVAERAKRRTLVPQEAKP